MANLKVQVNNSSSFDIMWARALREGTSHGFEIQGSGIIPISGNNQFQNSSAFNVCTEVVLLDSVVISAIGGAGTIQLQFSSGMENSITGSQTFRTAILNGAVSIPMKKIVSPATFIALNGWFGEGLTSTRAIAYFSGMKMTADLNFNANKVIMWIGDSVTRGSSIGGSALVGGGGAGSNLQTAVKPTDHYAFQVRNNFQRRSIDCRLVLKAMGGFNSIDMNACINEGFLDIEKADIIFYQLGINDAIAGSGIVSNDTFSQNLNAVIDFRLRKFPNSKLVFLGPTPLNNNTNETRLVELRTIMASKASTPDNIYYLSLESSFDRTVLTNYNLNDGIHPNIASNILVANVINNWVSSNNFTF
jgi:lysophospholipase L1-like esterase